jgi:hypothetical protein
MPEVAQNTWMTDYMPLATALQTQWPAGAKVMAKRDVQPYLLLYQSFANELKNYEKARRDAKENPALQRDLPAKRATAQTAGRKFKDNIPRFKSTAEALVMDLGAARDKSQLTPPQKEALLKLVQFINGLLKSVLGASPEDMFNVDVMLQKIDETTPLAGTRA